MSASVPAAELSFREGTAADLAGTFELSERAMHEVATRQGVVPRDPPLTEARIRADWLRHRALIEFMAAQDEGRYLICDGADGPVGYARLVRFGGKPRAVPVPKGAHVLTAGLAAGPDGRLWIYYGTRRRPG